MTGTERDMANQVENRFWFPLPRGKEGVSHNPAFSAEIHGSLLENSAPLFREWMAESGKLLEAQMSEKEMWAHFDAAFEQMNEVFKHADKGFEAARSIQPSQGCVCPPGAEKTCRGPLCPRRPIS